MDWICALEGVACTYFVGETPEGRFALASRPYSGPHVQPGLRAEGEFDSLHAAKLEAVNRILEESGERVYSLGETRALEFVWAPCADPARWAEPDDEAALDARDTRVERAVREHLADLAAEERELTEQLTAVRKRRQRLLQAVAHQDWVGLQGVVSAEDIESLCAVSPESLDVE